VTKALPSSDASASAGPSGGLEGGSRASSSDASADLTRGCREAAFDELPGDPDADWRTRPGARRYDHHSMKPFETMRRFPAGRLGDPVLDSAVRSAMTSYCTAREQSFLANARDAVREGQSSKDFVNECTCQATHVSPTLVSVGCANQASVGGAHPSWRYVGFTYALANGKAKAVTFDDVCMPRAQCTKRLSELVRQIPNGPPSYDERELGSYLAKPTFVLGPTYLRVLIEEDLTGYALHGLSCDLPYTELGALATLRP
jgi:hypothetical protein